MLPKTKSKIADCTKHPVWCRWQFRATAKSILLTPRCTELSRYRRRPGPVYPHRLLYWRKVNADWEGNSSNILLPLDRQGEPP